MTQLAMNANTKSAAQVMLRNRTGFNATPLGSAALEAATEGWKLILQTPDAGTGRPTGRHADKLTPNSSPAKDRALG